MTPTQQLLLAFLGAAENEIDPIRLVKGLFLVCQQVPEQWLSPGAAYRFVPYYFGPYSFELYGDLGALQRLGLVHAREVAGKSWKYQKLTSKGRAAADSLVRELDPRLLNYISTVRSFVDGLTMRQLLGSVYQRYPQFATRSVFKF